MRGKISDQDLTNYALNDGLDARERLYVESLLAVSEECRHDIYNLIEMGQLLEEGFERESGRVPATLTAEQRARLLQPTRRIPALAFMQKAAAAVAMAAFLGFIIGSPRLWHGASSGKIAKVSKDVSRMVQNAVAPNQDGDSFASFVDLRELVDDSSAWVQTANDSLPQTATICTPPSWADPSLGSLR